jgi:phospholipid/cholesterol/gamma-HCH transport system substrate-binding protein
MGAAGISACLVLSFLAARETHPGASHLRASFGRAGEGLDTHSDVKIRGVKVGGVSSVRLTEDGRALVTIWLNRGVRAPVTAEAAVVPLSVFGPKYIDLRPGQGEGTGPFLADGASIAKTADPQELTDVAAPAVRLFDALAPQDLATIMNALGTGFSGRGEEVGGLLDDSAKLLDLTARRRSDLGGIIGDGSALAQTAAAHGDEIGQITDDLNVIIPSVTGDPAQFGRLVDGLDQSARTLDQILESDPRGPGRIIDSVTPTAGVLYRYRSYFPDLLSGGNSILTQLAGIARAPGPHNTLLSRVTVHINPTNVLCESLPGLCGPIEPAVPNKPNPGTKRGN